MSAQSFPLPIDPEPVRSTAHLALGTAHHDAPSCTDGTMRVRAMRPAVMTDGADPLGPPPFQHRGAFCLGSVWQRPLVPQGEEQRLAVPLFAGTRDVAHVADSAAFMRLSEHLAAPDSPWHQSRRADVYAVPGAFVVWGVERLMADGAPSESSGYLAGVYVSDSGPVVLAPETMHSLLLHLTPASMSKGSQALFYNTLQALSERPVRTEREVEVPEVTEALSIFRSLHPRPVSRVQASSPSAGAEAAEITPAYLALVTG